ncbi:hypothetical protein NXY56_005779 [Leishmania guyanensis]
MQQLRRSCIVGGLMLRTTLQSTAHRAATIAVSAEGARQTKRSTDAPQGCLKPAAASNENTQAGSTPPRGAAQARSGGTTNTPRPVSSSAQWVEGTLQYDVAKVRHLAKVFAGVEAVAGRSRRTTSVEQHLRRRQRRNGPAALSQRKHGSRQVSYSDQRNCNADVTSNKNATGESGDEGRRSPSMTTLASALLTLTPSRFTDLVHSLVRVHFSIQPPSTGIQAKTPSSYEAAEVLTSLLTVSRLEHYMRDPSIAPLQLSEETLAASADDVVSLHSLSILASALEASVVAFSSTNVALVQEASTAIPGQAGRNAHEPKEDGQHMSQAGVEASAWRGEKVVAYSSLLIHLVHAFTECLAVLTESSFSGSRASFVRMDLLLLAVFSLMKVADVCAYKAGRSSPGDGATAACVERFSAENVAEQLQCLCLQLSVVCHRLSSSMVMTWTTSERKLDHFRGIPFLWFVVRQATQLRMQMQVLNTAPPFAGCVAALQNLIFIYYVSILRCVIAADSASMNAHCSDVTPRVDERGTARAVETSAQPDGRAAASACLTGAEKVQLAKRVELLWADMKPKPVISPAELSDLQHRTVHTALNVSLATWWKSAAATAASAFPSSSYWSQRPQHMATLLGSYNSLLAECRAALPVLSAYSAAQTAALPSETATASSVSSSLSWFVPFHSRLIRVGLDLQVEATVLAALHLGIEPRAPPTPATPIAKWIASRHRQRLRRRGASGGAESKVMPNDAAGAGASWGRVYRLCGGVRVAATELLYSAIEEVCCRVEERPLSKATSSSLSPPLHPSASRRPSLSSTTCANSGGVGSTSALAVALVNSVSRTFFAVPRMQYLFGYYTDATYTDRAAEEECRRVYAACLGVLVWLRELAPPFGVRAGEPPVARLVPPSSDVVRAAAGCHEPRAEDWLVCGTTSAIAMDGAFFVTYYLYHWPGQTGHPAGVSSAHGPQAERTAHDVALSFDGVFNGVPGPSISPLLTGATAVEYTKEMLFRLQHDTARQLRHLRATGRLHYFTGELQDKTKLLKDSTLRQRHVTSTLSVVQAHRKQPTLLWMPLGQAQEMVFLFDQYPRLFRCIDPAPSHGIRGVANEESDGGVMPPDGLREYPKVHVGDITCTFARVHGYLVKRLHVLSGILREYRSILLESSLHGAIDSHTISHGPSASVVAPMTSSFRGRLLDNATHSPQLEMHRRNNYEWAHVWAMQLHEEFPRLPARMEGAPRWSSGVMQMLERMERTMNDTHKQGLFINVVKSQQQYRELQRARSASPLPLPAEEAVLVDRTKGTSIEGPQVRDVVVQRDSERVPLGVVLDGDAKILRVQTMVTRPSGVADNSDEAEGDLLVSPFARALAQQQQEGQRLPGVSYRVGSFADVVGWRVLRVDGTAVYTGRDVAAQVRGKTEFTVTLQSFLGTQ